MPLFWPGGTGGISHNLCTLVVDVLGRIQKIIPENRWTADELVAELVKAATGRRQINVLPASCRQDADIQPASGTPATLFHAKSTGSTSTVSVTSSGRVSAPVIFANDLLSALIWRVRSMIW